MISAGDANAACDAFSANGRFVIQQNNGIKVFCTLVPNYTNAQTNFQTFSGNCNFGSTGGNVTGSITGRLFRMTAEWSLRSAGVYSGTINNDGWVEEGRTYDRNKPTSWAIWWFDGTALRCR